MPRQYFVRSEQTVSGPLDYERILEMLKEESLSVSDELSPDKIHWMKLMDTVDMLSPGFLEQLDSNKTAEKSTPSDEVSSSTSSTESSAKTTDNICKTEYPAIQPDRSFIRIISNTIGSIADGGACYLRLLQKGNYAIALAVFTALLLSFAVIISGGMLFKSLDQNMIWNYSWRSILWLIIGGSIVFVVNIALRIFSDNAQLLSGSCLTAALAMLSLAMLPVISLGIFRTILTSASWKIITAVLGAFWGFFLLNAIMIVRAGILESTPLRTGWSTFLAFTAIWLELAVYLIIVIPIYKI